MRTWILEGNTPTHISETLESEGLKPWEIAELISAAFEIIRVQAKRDPLDKRAWMDGALLTTYQKLMMTGDYPGALTALKEYSRLNKLYDIQDLNHKPKNPGVTIIEDPGFSEEEFT